MRTWNWEGAVSGYIFAEVGWNGDGYQNTCVWKLKKNWTVLWMSKFLSVEWLFSNEFYQSLGVGSHPIF